jgi:DeoR/GlpR family transcriptional regulator of sugar metabolism
VEVALCGGRYHGDFNSCTGPEVTRILSRIRAERALLLVDHSKFGS